MRHHFAYHVGDAHDYEELRVDEAHDDEERRPEIRRDMIVYHIVIIRNMTPDGQST